MKRKIKFRAWHPKQKIMAYSDSRKRFTDNSLGDFFDHRIYPYQDWNLMQYTGLKDKNEKEIYEGDIIKIGHYIDDDCIIHEVEYCGHRDYPAFELKPDVGADSNGLSWAIADATIFEIIGNIYENPELIEHGNNKS